MPTSVCLSCEKEVNWRSTRGSSAPKVCSCGGMLKRGIWTPHGYVPNREGQEGKTKGRKLVPCVLCGRRRSVPGGGRILETETAYRTYAGPFPNATATVTAPVGSTVCWHHSPDFPVRVPTRPPQEGT